MADTLSLTTNMTVNNTEGTAAAVRVAYLRSTETDVEIDDYGRERKIGLAVGTYTFDLFQASADGADTLIIVVDNPVTIEFQEDAATPAWVGPLTCSSVMLLTPTSMLQVRVTVITEDTSLDMLFVKRTEE